MRKEVLMLLYGIYEKDDEFHLCGNDYHIDIMPISEVTPESIYNYLIPNYKNVSFREIKEWFDNGCEDSLFIDQSPHVKGPASDNEVYDDVLEIELREFIQPPFGVLGGKKIDTHTWHEIG